jgi:hypothetical protein
MDASDVIKRNKQRAIYTNYQVLLNTQIACVAVNCVQGGCIVRYPTYEYRQDVIGGSADCACGCPPTVVPQAVEPMFSMVINASAPVSFAIITIDATESLVIDWGDGSRDVYTTIDDGGPGPIATATHTYAVPGTYTISGLSPIESGLFLLLASGIDVTSIIFTPVAKLTLSELDLSNNQLTTIDISNCPVLQVVDLRNNLLTVNAVNTILVDLVNNGFNTGTVNLENQTPAAAPSAGPPDGLAAITTLQTLPFNWTITVD